MFESAGTGAVAVFPRRRGSSAHNPAARPRRGAGSSHGSVEKPRVEVRALHAVELEPVWTVRPRPRPRTGRRAANQPALNHLAPSLRRPSVAATLGRPEQFASVAQWCMAIYLWHGRDEVEVAGLLSVTGTGFGGVLVSGSSGMRKPGAAVLGNASILPRSPGLGCALVIRTGRPPAVRTVIEPKRTSDIARARTRVRTRSRKDESYGVHLRTTGASRSDPD